MISNPASRFGEGKRFKQGKELEMAKKTWVFNTENQRHMVEVEWSR